MVSYCRFYGPDASESTLIPNQPISTPISPMDSRVEMFQKGDPRDQFFNMKALAPRPMSTATVFDIDYEEDDDSEIEDDSPISPRFSLNSVSRPACMALHPLPIC